jgi:hypothetical protein
LSLLEIPDVVRDQCGRADITARSVLLQIARLKSPSAMREAIDEAAAGSTRDDLRRKKGESGGKRPSRFSFIYKPRGGPFKLNLSFQKSRVDKSELIDTLRQVIKQLEAGEIKLPKR